MCAKPPQTWIYFVENTSSKDPREIRHFSATPFYFVINPPPPGELPYGLWGFFAKKFRDFRGFDGSMAQNIGTFWTKTAKIWTNISTRGLKNPKLGGSPTRFWVKKLFKSVFLGFQGSFSTIFHRKTGPGTHFMAIFRRNTEKIVYFL